MFIVVSLMVRLALAGLTSLTNMYGSLESPNFPKPYPQEAELQWNVSVPRGFQICLFFSHLDLELSHLCQYDYLKVEAEGAELALLCGRSHRDEEAEPAQSFITSPSNQMMITFKSDFSDEERFTGFRAHYSAIDIDECSKALEEESLCDHFCHNFIGGYYCSCRHGYQLHTDNRTCSVQCSGLVFTERRGILTSPDFPSPYPKSSDCSYIIRVEPGFRLRLQFNTTFDVEDHPDIQCPYDYVTVHSREQVWGPFCGSESPGLIRTNSSFITIDFHSDNSGENRGWRMDYTTTGSQCPQPEAPPHAVLNPVQSEYFFKDHLVFTCELGYHLYQDGDSVDQYQLECLADGSWSGRPPQCRVVDCGPPEDVELAVMVFGSMDNSTAFGSTLRYICTDGNATNQKNFSFSCESSGKWVNLEGRKETPTCPTACGHPSRPLPVQVKRIVGGRGAQPGLFPWQVLLSVEDLSRVPEDRWFGSGALLSPSWVLTAAHVLRTRRRDSSVVPVAPDHVKVFLGLHDTRHKLQATNRSVQQVFLHPDFQPHNYDNDIALLRLTERVLFNQNIRPVCLPPPHTQGAPPNPPPHSLGVVAGWGISNANGSSPDPMSMTSDLGVTSDLLQYVKLPVVPQAECTASYASRSISYNVTDNMFCAGFLQGGRDTCLGDSGGAFVVQDGDTRRWAVLGLVSWGGPEECGSQRVYGVYTRVSKYVDWINAHLNDTTWW
ncbi:mannan-binding lectin serine protease 1 isoform X2 [Gouania willdenowi]|uniref:Mannan-binding lectin serine protease 1 n=1 Tax=Gouania willdenowi TaxID=441366 RepID=A0A8C5E6R8_GOUWI|nr:mannan-binding lectin serine protease 1 isoform X2 [Gouania willdenowi]